MRIRISALAALIIVALAACDGDFKQEELAAPDTTRDTIIYVAAADSASFLEPTAIPVTMPVLYAFFSDTSFASTLRDSLQLTDQQIEELRAAAGEEAQVVGSDTAAMEGAGTMGARQHAMERISGIIGPQKTYALGRLVRDRWTGDTTGIGAAPSTYGTVPQDTRVVINGPAFRMDLFRDGELVKSYRIASGYPEFPLPTGLRTAREIIFNPPWTPPDEPWVESSNKVKVGERVAPGSKNNPLGIMKIPIGMPSLIHGGKNGGQLGTFGSHGCAGLTDVQARDFALLLAEASGAELTAQQIAEYGSKRTATEVVKLENPVPVELRYETIVVQDGAVHFYPDIYEHGTTNLQTLRQALEAHGVQLEQLTEPERKQLMDALAAMGGDTTSTAGSPLTTGDSGVGAARGRDTGKQKDVKLTRSVKGPKENIVRIASLKGKGYPKMVTGGA